MDNATKCVIAILCDEFERGFDYARWLREGKVSSKIRRVAGKRGRQK